jgi:hypothetical protein
MKKYAVAPIHTNGVALRHVGPRDATCVPLSVLTWSLSNLSLVVSPEPPLSSLGQLFGTERFANIRKDSPDGKRIDTTS